jgi:cardiolipin synthase
MESRTSQGAIAWVLFLIFVPYVSLIAYWVLGRSRFEGYISTKQLADEQVERKIEEIFSELEPYLVTDGRIANVEGVAEKLASFPFLHGNDVELLIDGEATFDSIVNGIEAAESYILFQFFIVKDDELGQRIKRHLVAKAREGVKVYFLYDEIGSHKLDYFYRRELRDAGIEIHEFNTQKGITNKFQINFRNHRKIVVVDGKAAWIGGHNVGDEYLGKNKKFGHWRDTHIKIEGPSVLAAQLSFVEDWFWTTERLVDKALWSPVSSKQGDKKVLIVPSAPADRLETAGLMFHHAINTARRRLWIASPYFVPDDATLAALQLAGLRGVDVRILIPEKPDHLLVYLAAFTYFEDIAETGVRFFRYTDGFLHQKVMLVDDDAASVGTANFDNRSFRLNFEITAIVADREFVGEIEEMFLDDFAHSREMSKEDIDGKSFAFRLATHLARLTAPIL